jgi:multidrug efflux system outer membrane protein
MISLNRTKSLITAGAVAVLAVTGCTVGPNYTRPQVNPPASFRGSDNSAVADSAKDSLGDEQWGTVFHQPELQQLIRTALETNFDLRIAAQRILEQEQQVRITRAQQFPALSLGATGVAAALPSTSGAFSAGTSTTTSPLSLGLSAAWTPDFWGLYRRQTEAARDQLLAQTWAQRAVRLTLVEDVVTTYLQLRSLDQQLAIARQTLSTRAQSVDLTRRLESGGAVPLSDLRQAEELLYGARAAVPSI